ncbi:MAG: sensor histidine kinase [Elusimicrobia bacterium]|nr:sensor histidine kinase [Elusimicrobiota bacterium]
MISSAVVSVADTGPGIPPGELDKIFDRLHRSELTRKAKGSGLGLAIVRGMVAANRGRVHAENAPAGGSVFHVALPVPGRAHA